MRRKPRELFLGLAALSATSVMAADWGISARQPQEIGSGGACCVINGFEGFDFCNIVESKAMCDSLLPLGHATYHPGSDCADGCETVGACCTPGIGADIRCVNMHSEADCLATHRPIYQGDGTICTPVANDALYDECPFIVVPAVSEWGLVVLTLIGFVAGTMLFRNRRLHRHTVAL